MIEIYCTLSAILPSPHRSQLNSLLGLLKIRKNLLTLGARRLEVSHHVESVLGKVVTLTSHDALERVNGLGEVNELTLDTSENLLGKC